MPRAEPTPRSTGTNDLLAFLTFVEHHKPGSSVNAIVENYSSHGAYVRIGDVKGYVPLSLMSDPPPRSAREFMKIGESITLVVESFAPARRSIDLAIPTMTTVKMPPPERPTRPSRNARQEVRCEGRAAPLRRPAQPKSPPPFTAAPKRRGEEARPEEGRDPAAASPMCQAEVARQEGCATAAPATEPAVAAELPAVAEPVPQPPKKRAPRKARRQPPRLLQQLPNAKPSRRRAKSA